MPLGKGQQYFGDRNTGMVYTQCKDGLELTDTLNEHRDAALRIQFEKDGSLTNTGYCGISVKAGESYSLYLFAKAKEEIGLDVAIEYQGKVLTGNSLGGFRSGVYKI